MKKRFLAIGIGTALLLGMLSGCGGGDTSKPAASAPDGSGGDGSTPAAASYTIKVAYTPGNMAAEDSPDIMFGDVFKEYVEENSNGQIKVELYPSGQLGTAEETLQGVISGTVELSVIDASLLGNIYEPVQALSTPGLFGSTEQANEVIQGEWGQQFMSDIGDNVNVKLLGMHCKGMRCFTNNVRELKSPSDASGITFRVMENTVSIRMVEALGAIATPMSGSEMYSALETGVVDGQENPVINIVQDLTYEVQEYLTLDEHMAGFMAYIMNVDFYNSLPDDLKAVIDEGSAQAVQAALDVVVNRSEECVQELVDYGMQVYTPTAEEKEEWHQILFDGTIDYVRGVVGDEMMDGLVAAVEAA